MIIRRSARFVLAASAAGAAALAAAPAADGKIFFGDMAGRSLAWGERVSSTIANCPGNDSCRQAVEGVSVYLRRGPRSRSRPDPDALERVARVDANGTIRFRVPRLKPGRYHLLGRIPAGDAKRWFPVSGTFRIRR